MHEHKKYSWDVNLLPGEANNFFINSFSQTSGAPNKNIVQNHLNIASGDPKIIGIKTYLFKNLARKKAPENSR